MDCLDRWRMPAAWDLPWRVKALEGINHVDEAITVCKEWLSLEPDNSRGLWALTHLEVRRDGIEPVLKKMGKLARIPSRPIVYKEIHAHLCRRAGRPEQAVRQYERMARSTADPLLRYQPDL